MTARACRPTGWKTSSVHWPKISPRVARGWGCICFAGWRRRTAAGPGPIAWKAKAQPSIWSCPRPRRTATRPGRRRRPAQRREGRQPPPPPPPQGGGGGEGPPPQGGGGGERPPPPRGGGGEREPGRQEGGEGKKVELRG